MNPTFSSTTAPRNRGHTTAAPGGASRTSTSPGSRSNSRIRSVAPTAFCNWLYNSANCPIAPATKVMYKPNRVRSPKLISPCCNRRAPDHSTSKMQPNKAKMMKDKNPARNLALRSVTFRNRPNPAWYRPNS